MVSITFVIALLSILLIPGLALVSCVNIRQHRYLAALSFSYGLFAIISVTSRLLELSFQYFTWVVSAYLTITLIILTLAILRWLKESNKTWFDIEQRNVILGAVGIFVSLAGYYAVVGPYTEIPADIYYHIEKFALVHEIFTGGELGKPKQLLIAISQGAEVWYHLIAFVAILTEASTNIVVYWASFISMVLFLFSVYVFSLKLFKSHQAVVLIALFATFLMAIHYGVTVFSYLRYYSFAPAMLAFIFYFYAVLLFLDILDEGVFKGVFFRLLCIVLLLFAVLFIHKQEAMYIVIQLSVMLNIFVIRKVVCTFTCRKTTSQYDQWSAFEKAAGALVVCMTVVFSAAYVYMHFNKGHFGDLGNRLWELGPAVGILPKLSILNPSYQFMQVVTLWGLLVYGLFFLNWRRYQNNIYLMAGMLLPLFTVFNPFFTDLFLRVVDSTVLWRFCFLLPIHYVAADLFVFYIRRVLESGVFLGKSEIKKHYASLLGICALLVFLLPLYNTWNGFHYSRYPTLKASNDAQSYHHLQDVVDFLQTISEKKVLLTDPVTGYVLTGFTRHYSARDKFSINPYSGFQQFTFDDYSSKPLAKYSGALLVINKRTINQGDSFVGALSRHWPPDLFQRIAPFYTEPLMNHLEDERLNYDIIYQLDDVIIYKL